MMTASRSLVPLALAAVFACGARADQPDARTFQESVRPFFSKNCFTCHSHELQTAGLDLEAFTGPESVAQSREEWEKLAEKLRTRQMPPPGMPRPAEADVKAVLSWVSAEFDRLDRAAKPDPGRI